MADLLFWGLLFAVLSLIVYLIRRGAGAEMREALHKADAELAKEQLDSIEAANASKYKIQVEDRESYESVDTKQAAGRFNDTVSKLRKN